MTRRRATGRSLLKPGKPIKLVTVAQAAEILQVSVSSVYRLIDEGVPKAVRPLRGKILIEASDLQRHQEHAADPEFWGRGDASTHLAKPDLSRRSATMAAGNPHQTQPGTSPQGCNERSVAAPRITNILLADNTERCILT